MNTPFPGFWGDALGYNGELLLCLTSGPPRVWGMVPNSKYRANKLYLLPHLGGTYVCGISLYVSVGEREALSGTRVEARDGQWVSSSLIFCLLPLKQFLTDLGSCHARVRIHWFTKSSSRVADTRGYAWFVMWLLGSELRSLWLKQVFLPNKNFFSPLFLAFHSIVHLIHQTWTCKHHQESSLCLSCHL